MLLNGLQARSLWIWLLVALLPATNAWLHESKCYAGCDNSCQGCCVTASEVFGFYSKGIIPYYQTAYWTFPATASVMTETLTATINSRPSSCVKQVKAPCYSSSGGNNNQATQGTTQAASQAASQAVTVTVTQEGSTVTQPGSTVIQTVPTTVTKIDSQGSTITVTSTAQGSAKTVTVTGTASVCSAVTITAQNSASCAPTTVTVTDKKPFLSSTELSSTTRGTISSGLTSSSFSSTVSSQSLSLSSSGVCASSVPEGEGAYGSLNECSESCLEVSKGFSKCSGSKDCICELSKTAEALKCEICELWYANSDVQKAVSISSLPDALAAAQSVISGFVDQCAFKTTTVSVCLPSTSVMSSLSSSASLPTSSMPVPSSSTQATSSPIVSVFTSSASSVSSSASASTPAVNTTVTGPAPASSSASGSVPASSSPNVPCYTSPVDAESNVGSLQDCSEKCEWILKDVGACKDKKDCFCTIPADAYAKCLKCKAVYEWSSSGPFSSDLSPTLDKLEKECGYRPPSISLCYNSVSSSTPGPSSSVVSTALTSRVLQPSNSTQPATSSPASVSASVSASTLVSSTTASVPVSASGSSASTSHSNSTQPASSWPASVSASSSTASVPASTLSSSTPASVPVSASGSSVLSSQHYNTTQPISSVPTSHSIPQQPSSQPPTSSSITCIDSGDVSSIDACEKVCSQAVAELKSAKKGKSKKCDLFSDIAVAKCLFCNEKFSKVESESGNSTIGSNTTAPAVSQDAKIVFSAAKECGIAPKPQCVAQIPGSTVGPTQTPPVQGATSLVETEIVVAPSTSLVPGTTREETTVVITTNGATQSTVVQGTTVPPSVVTIVKTIFVTGGHKPGHETSTTQASPSDSSSSVGPHLSMQSSQPRESQPADSVITQPTTIVMSGTTRQDSTIVETNGGSKQSSIIKGTTVGPSIVTIVKTIYASDSRPVASDASASAQNPLSSTVQTVTEVSTMAPTTAQDVTTVVSHDGHQSMTVVPGTTRGRSVVTILKTYTITNGHGGNGECDGAGNCGGISNHNGNGDSTDATTPASLGSSAGQVTSTLVTTEISTVAPTTVKPTTTVISNDGGVTTKTHGGTTRGPSVVTIVKTLTVTAGSGPPTLNPGNEMPSASSANTVTPQNTPTTAGVQTITKSVTIESYCEATTSGTVVLPPSTSTYVTMTTLTVSGSDSAPPVSQPTSAAGTTPAQNGPSSAEVQTITRSVTITSYCEATTSGTVVLPPSTSTYVTMTTLTVSGSDSAPPVSQPTSAAGTTPAQNPSSAEEQTITRSVTITSYCEATTSGTVVLPPSTSTYVTMTTLTVSGSDSAPPVSQPTSAADTTPAQNGPSSAEVQTITRSVTITSYCEATTSGTVVLPPSTSTYVTVTTLTVSRPGDASLPQPENSGAAFSTPNLPSDHTSHPYKGHNVTETTIVTVTTSVPGSMSGTVTIPGGVSTLTTLTTRTLTSTSTGSGGPAATVTGSYAGVTQTVTTLVTVVETNPGTTSGTVSRTGHCITYTTLTTLTVTDTAVSKLPTVTITGTTSVRTVIVTTDVTSVITAPGSMSGTVSVPGKTSTMTTYLTFTSTVPGSSPASSATSATVVTASSSSPVTSKDSSQLPCFTTPADVGSQDECVKKCQWIVDNVRTCDGNKDCVCKIPSDAFNKCEACRAVYSAVATSGLEIFRDSALTSALGSLSSQCSYVPPSVSLCSSVSSPASSGPSNSTALASSAPASSGSANSTVAISSPVSSSLPTSLAPVGSASASSISANSTVAVSSPSASSVFVSTASASSAPAISQPSNSTAVATPTSALSSLSCTGLGCTASSSAGDRSLQADSSLVVSSATSSASTADISSLSTPTSKSLVVLSSLASATSQPSCVSNPGKDVGPMEQCGEKCAWILKEVVACGGDKTCLCKIPEDALNVCKRGKDVYLNGGSDKVPDSFRDGNLDSCLSILAQKCGYSVPTISLCTTGVTSTRASTSSMESLPVSDSTHQVMSSTASQTISLSSKTSMTTFSSSVASQGVSSSSEASQVVSSSSMASQSMTPVSVASQGAISTTNVKYNSLTSISASITSMGDTAEATSTGIASSIESIITAPEPTATVTPGSSCQGYGGHAGPQPILGNCAAGCLADYKQCCVTNGILGKVTCLKELADCKCAQGVGICCAVQKKLQLS